MKRAALYLRISTIDQHVETQLHDLKALAESRGFQVVQVYEDRSSGARASRPGLDQLLADARRGKFEVVVAWACDRLARSVTHFLQVLDELNHLGIEFVSFREQLDTGGPLGRDRKSTRLNSSHGYISYAVFCLKKKKKEKR